MRSRITLAVLACLLVGGILEVLHLRFESNDLLPEYSSLRTDPQGLTVLFAALEATGAVPVSRSNRPLGLLKNTDATVVIAGADRFAWLDSEASIPEVERLANRGNRVVIAVGRSLSEVQNQSPHEPLLEKWGVHVLAMPDQTPADDDEPAHWPAYFLATSEWHVVQAEKAHALIIERNFQAGSVVLLASAWLLTNEAMVQDRHSETLAALLCAKPQVIFDESHLGLVQTSSVMALSRTFHLQGFLIGLGVLAGLFLWRNLFGFPPDRKLAERRTGRDSLTGLSILLARNVPEKELIDMCLAERQKSGERRLSPDMLAKARVRSSSRKNVFEGFEAIRQELHNL